MSPYMVKQLYLQKKHTVTEITQAIYQYLKQGYVLTRIPLNQSSYRKEQTKQI